MKGREGRVGVTELTIKYPLCDFQTQFPTVYASDLDLTFFSFLDYFVHSFNLTAGSIHYCLFDIFK